MHTYISVPIVGVAGTICLSLIRSIMSRAVSQDSQGKALMNYSRIAL